MSADPVGQGVQQNGAFTVGQDLLLPLECINDGEGIIPVNPFGVHHFRIHAGTNPGQDPVSHGFTTGLPSHPVLVVHEIEDDRQAPLIVLFP